jgi:hypothetical protein
VIHPSAIGQPLGVADALEDMVEDLVETALVDALVDEVLYVLMRVEVLAGVVELTG